MAKVKCRDCGLLKTRTFQGDLKTDGRKVYTEGKAGRRWNGRQCPDCKYAIGSGKYTKESPNGLGPSLSVDPLTDRKCTECNKRLPQSRYFRHKECDDKLHASEGQGFYSAEDWGYASLGSASEPLNFKISEMHLLGAQ